MKDDKDKSTRRVLNNGWLLLNYYRLLKRRAKINSDDYLRVTAIRTDQEPNLVLSKENLKFIKTYTLRTKQSVENMQTLSTRG